jgi:hypothetical protein
MQKKEHLSQSPLLDLLLMEFEYIGGREVSTSSEDEDWEQLDYDDREELDD